MIEAPGLSVIGSQLALVISLSASGVPGFGPKPKTTILGVKDYVQSKRGGR